ncbi:hypothetical protein [Haloflavibacter putidus]|uniref:Cytochrome C n=1 Tax=Haloflavibacter putidus TaxID=2576776 RepID=A0A507ZNC5_9FLAO|nr:hypothetical protein [Haloflavibacter putidus]TQD37744.1 hypothetical protein FKR84_09735 [Haloflavibacter putidus]
MHSKTFLVCLFVGIFFACQENKPTATAKENSVKENQEKDAFEMYQMSEMAAFMEILAAEHSKMKSTIKDGNSPDSLRFAIDKIFTANFTNPEDRDAKYLEWAEEFKTYELKIVADPKNAKQHYNNAINTCISCHESKCTGPLTRIKKLQIK